MRKAWLGLLLLAAVLLPHPACEVPPLTNPGSSIALFANPEFIVANGGVSVITALVVEPAGTFVPDGSVVYFFTNLGRIDPQAKTRDGLARVNLVSDARSGKATVTAFSGGAAPVATGTGGGSSSGIGSTTKDVNIGSALPTRVLVSANPQSVRGGGPVAITANVFDTPGNPVSNVPVIFSLGGMVANERLESGGAQLFTDNNGQVFDTLLTRLVAVSKTVTVTAVTANGIAATPTSVTINP